MIKTITFIFVFISTIALIPSNSVARPSRLDTGIRIVYHKDIQVYSPQFRASQKFQKGKFVIGTHFDMIPLINVNGTINVGQQYLLEMGIPSLIQYISKRRMIDENDYNKLLLYFMIYGSNFEFHLNKHIALVMGHNLDIIIFKNKSRFQGAFITPHIGIDINGIPFHYRFTVSKGILWDFNVKNKNYDLTLGFSFYANMPTF